MVDFSVHADRLSAEVDNRLGDVVSYAVGGANGGAYINIKARVFAAEPTRGWEKGDEMRGGWRLRVAKVHVPLPSIADRIQCEPILGAGEVYRPVSKDPINDGRYWLVDLQRV